MAAVGVRRRDMQWLAVGGTCGLMVAWVHGACGVRMRTGIRAVRVVLLRAAAVLCVVDAARAWGFLRRVVGPWRGRYGW